MWLACIEYEHMAYATNRNPSAIAPHGLFAPRRILLLSVIAVGSSVTASVALAGGLTEVTLKKPAAVDTRFVTSSVSDQDGGTNARAPVGQDFSDAPLVVTVDLDRQHLVAFKGLKSVFHSRISSGKTGHATPMGIFSILEKKRYHESNIYSNAPMPYMQRLTWSGIALHEGRVPPYPASHGCIRLPEGLAKNLFSKTAYGGHVIVMRGEARPFPIVHHGLFQPDPVEALVASLRPAILPQTADDALFGMNTNSSETSAPLRIFITRASARDRIMAAQEMLIGLGYLDGEADGIPGSITIGAIRKFQEGEELPITGKTDQATLEKLQNLAKRPLLPNGKLLVRRNQRDILQADVIIRDDDQPLGTHLAYVGSLSDERADWLTISVPTLLKPSTIREFDMKPEWGRQRVRASLRTALDRLEIPDHAREFIEHNLTPGTSFAISDNGLGTETGKGTDFIVQTY